MNKNIFTAMALLMALPMTAQDVYDAANLATSDLNGTARYVGMGGALDALGADISTISSNPAGIGMFRHSEIRGSLGVVSQEGVSKAMGTNKTNLSFDQIGFVWANQTSPLSYVNFAFNYHKSRNFNQILAAANQFAPSRRTFDDNGNMIGLEGSGQNLQTVIKDYRGLFDADKSDVDGVNYYQSQVDYMYGEILTFNDGNYRFMAPLAAESFDYARGTHGYINNFDFNLSGNSNNRIYWGLTVGIHDVDYESHTSYSERLESAQTLPNGTRVGEAGLRDDRSISGQGFDIKAGLIARPIAESAFRIGLSIASPTWFKLTVENNSAAYVDMEKHSGESYDFKYYTPWKFGLSLGHTIGNYLALGAGYEFSDYTSCDMRYLTGASGYDSEESKSDAEMNEEIGYCLRGVHTLKLGAEFKPDPTVAVRLGYNFVSPQFDSNDEAYRSPRVYSPGVYYASTTDYTNWRATHRITAGIGTKIDKVSLDLAYQYSVTNGDFFPFSDGEYYDDGVYYIENKTPATKVDFKRHQILFTLGYTF